MAHSSLAAVEGNSNAGAAGESGKRDIIVADDNVDALQTLAMLLEMEGHRVRTANDGMQALALMHERVPDVMLLDIGMPGMNGYEVAQRVREAGEHVTLIALTGWGQPSDRAHASEAGFDHHLTKPVEFPELEKLLTQNSVTGQVARQAPSSAATRRVSGTA